MYKNLIYYFPLIMVCVIPLYVNSTSTATIATSAITAT